MSSRETVVDPYGTCLGVDLLQLPQFNDLFHSEDNYIKKVQKAIEVSISEQLEQLSETSAMMRTPTRMSFSDATATAILSHTPSHSRDSHCSESRPSTSRHADTLVELFEGYDEESADDLKQERESSSSNSTNNNKNDDITDCGLAARIGVDLDTEDSDTVFDDFDSECADAKEKDSTDDVRLAVASGSSKKHLTDKMDKGCDDDSIMFRLDDLKICDEDYVEDDDDDSHCEVVKVELPNAVLPKATMLCSSRTLPSVAISRGSLALARAKKTKAAEKRRLMASSSDSTLRKGKPVLGLKKSLSDKLPLGKPVLDELKASSLPMGVSLESSAERVPLVPRTKMDDVLLLRESSSKGKKRINCSTSSSRKAAASGSAGVCLTPATTPGSVCGSEASTQLSNVMPGGFCKKTLILDVDNTMIHVKHFMDEMCVGDRVHFGELQARVIKLYYRMELDLRKKGKAFIIYDHCITSSEQKVPKRGDWYPNNEHKTGRINQIEPIGCEIIIVPEENEDLQKLVEAHQKSTRERVAASEDTTDRRHEFDSTAASALRTSASLSSAPREKKTPRRRPRLGSFPTVSSTPRIVDIGDSSRMTLTPLGTATPTSGISITPSAIKVFTFPLSEEEDGDDDNDSDNVFESSEKSTPRKSTRSSRTVASKSSSPQLSVIDSGSADSVVVGVRNEDAFEDSASAAAHLRRAKSAPQMSWFSLDLDDSDSMSCNSMDDLEQFSAPKDAIFISFTENSEALIQLNPFVNRSNCIPVDLMYGGYLVRFRPGLLNFLLQANKLFDVFLFTAADGVVYKGLLKEVHKTLIGSLKERFSHSEHVGAKHRECDSRSLWSRILYRCDCDDLLLDNGMSYKHKNASKFGRDFRGVVIIDDNPLSFRGFDPNVIRISSFWGFTEPRDKELLEIIMPLLRKVAGHCDVRYRLSNLCESPPSDIRKLYEVAQEKGYWTATDCIEFSTRFLHYLHRAAEWARIQREARARLKLQTRASLSVNTTPSTDVGDNSPDDDSDALPGDNPPLKMSVSAPSHSRATSGGTLRDRSWQGPAAHQSRFCPGPGGPPAYRGHAHGHGVREHERGRYHGHGVHEHERGQGHGHPHGAYFQQAHGHAHPRVHVQVASDSRGRVPMDALGYTYSMPHTSHGFAQLQSQAHARQQIAGGYDRFIPLQHSGGGCVGPGGSTTPPGTRASAGMPLVHGSSVGGAVRMPHTGSAVPHAHGGFIQTTRPGEIGRVALPMSHLPQPQSQQTLLARRHSVDVGLSHHHLVQRPGPTQPPPAPGMHPHLTGFYGASGGGAAHHAAGVRGSREHSWRAAVPHSAAAALYQMPKAAAVQRLPQPQLPQLPQMPAQTQLRTRHSTGSFVPQIQLDAARRQRMPAATKPMTPPSISSYSVASSSYTLPRARSFTVPVRRTVAATTAFSEAQKREAMKAHLQAAAQRAWALEELQMKEARKQWQKGSALPAMAPMLSKRLSDQSTTSTLSSASMSASASVCSDEMKIMEHPTCDLWADTSSRRTKSLPIIIDSDMRDMILSEVELQKHRQALDTSTALCAASGGRIAGVSILIPDLEQTASCPRHLAPSLEPNGCLSHGGDTFSKTPTSKDIAQSRERRRSVRISVTRPLPLLTDKSASDSSMPGGKPPTALPRLSFSRTSKSFDGFRDGESDEKIDETAARRSTELRPMVALTPKSRRKLEWRKQRLAATPQSDECETEGSSALTVERLNDLCIAIGNEDSSHRSTPDSKSDSTPAKASSSSSFSTSASYGSIPVRKGSFCSEKTRERESFEGSFEYTPEIDTNDEDDEELKTFPAVMTPSQVIRTSYSRDD